MYIWIWYWLRQCTKDSNLRMLNSLMAYCGVCLTWLDGKYQSKLIEYSFCFNCEYNNFTNILKNVTETLTLFQTVMSKKWNQDQTAQNCRLDKIRKEGRKIFDTSTLLSGDWFSWIVLSYCLSVWHPFLKCNDNGILKRCVLRTL